MFTVIRTPACALFFLLTAITLSPAQQVPPQTPQTATVIGTVLDVTGATVPNAHVVLQGPAERRTFVTGDNGFFSFEEVKAGIPVRVEVSAPDLKNWSSNEIILQPGQSFIVTDISLGVATVEMAVSAATPEQVAVEQVKIQEQQRVFGVVPNFFVTYERDAAPLTPKLKFQLAMKALTDPVTIAGFGMNAAIYQAAGYPSYRQGAAGYGKRLGATFAGGYSKILLGDAIFPSLLHQDPRYFYQGTGTTKSRLLHAMATPFSPEETTANERSTTRTSWATWPPGRLRTPIIPAKTAAQDLWFAVQRLASAAVWFSALSRSSCFISGRRNTPVNHNLVTSTKKMRRPNISGSDYTPVRTLPSNILRR